jgi:aryl sulfotransferase
LSSIVWLASYPKSGNTWLRALLSNYLRDADVPADINALGKEWFAHASRRVLFDELVGVEASALEQAAIDRLRPETYRCLAHEAPQVLYLKVHDSWALTDDGNALFPADVTAGVIYILRNPLDVAPSFANHLGVSVDAAVDRMCDESFAMSNSPERMDEQLRQHVGSWSGHVRSWLDHSGLPCRVVRYEDLRHDPERVFGEVVRFCGLPDEGPRLRKAIAFSDFAELRRQEQENGFRERLRVAAGGFFRRGVAGGWREELPAGLALRLVEAHHETMRRFGYLDASTLTEVTLAAGIDSRT